MIVWMVAAAAAEDTEPAASPAEAPAKAPKEWTWTALPITNFSSDTGVGYGGYGTVVHQAGPGEDRPYKLRVALQLFATTRQYQDHNLKVDLPEIGGSPYRIDLLVGYERWKQAPWYGLGNIGPRLHRDDQPTDDHYQYDVSWARALVNVRRNVGGDVDLFANWLFRVASVDTYSGSLLEQAPPLGADGGVYARLGAGVMIDTRDAEPSPTSGVWTEASARVSHPVVGSSFKVFGANFTDRRWYSLGGGGRAVLASRFIADVHRGDEPFFAIQVLGGSQFVEFISNNNLRGLGNGRYRGDVMLAWTPELRLKYGSIGSVDIFGVPFVDVGRVFLWQDNPALADGSGLADPKLSHLHATAGVGHRVQVGTNMLVRFDVGVGAEEFGVPGVPEVVERAPNVSVYLAFDHPF